MEGNRELKITIKREDGTEGYATLNWNEWKAQNDWWIAKEKEVHAKLFGLKTISDK